MTKASDRPTGGDPWSAFGYLVAGVLLYGGLGLLLDRWWNTGFMVVVGILGGAGLGLFMTWARFGAHDENDTHSTS
jgi:ATP synthase protein I